MGTWGDWRERAYHATQFPKQSVEPQTVRVASDCSGLGTAELGLASYGAKYGLKVHSVWCCDSSPLSQSFLKKNVYSDHTFVDITTRAYDRSSFTATGGPNGAAITVSRRNSNLDLYTACVSSTPFSHKLEGCQDQLSLTFAHVVKTIKALQPRVSIIEAKPSILMTRHWPNIKNLLKGISSQYWLQIMRDIQNENFGLPHVRKRVYFVFIQKKYVTGDPCGSVEPITKGSYTDARLPFNLFFEQNGCPLVPRPTTQPAEMEPCTCSPKRVCRVHCCSCQRCSAFGRQTTKCNWRATIANWQKKRS